MKRIMIVLIAFASLATCVHSQQNVPDLTGDKDGTGYLSKLNYRTGEIIFYRDITEVSAPAVRILKADGTTIPIYPLAELPGARAMTVWDIAETPEGGVVFSAIAEYGPRKTKHVPAKAFLLTYGRDGRLTKLWDVYPYEHHHVAVDDSGNVFGLGTKDTSSNNYPLLVKYSPDGKVLGEFLPAKLFSVGDEVVGSGSPNGETEMFVDGEGLFIWLGPSQEILRLSTSGEIRARNSFDRALSLLAEQSETKRAKIVEIAETNGQVVAQVLLFPKEKGKRATLVMTTFANDGNAAHFISVGPSHAGRFLGVTRYGKLVFFEQAQPGHLVITQY